MRIGFVYTLVRQLYSTLLLLWYFISKTSTALFTTIELRSKLEQVYEHIPTQPTGSTHTNIALSHTHRTHLLSHKKALLEMLGNSDYTEVSIHEERYFLFRCISRILC